MQITYCSAFAELCNHHHRQFWSIFTTPKRNPQPVAVLPLPPTSTPNLLSVSLDVPVLTEYFCTFQVPSVPFHVCIGPERIVQSYTVKHFICFLGRYRLVLLKLECAANHLGHRAKIPHVPQVWGRA